MFRWLRRRKAQPIPAPKPPTGGSGGSAGDVQYAYQRGRQVIGMLVDGTVVEIEPATGKIKPYMPPGTHPTHRCTACLGCDSMIRGNYCPRCGRRKAHAPVRSTPVLLSGYHSAADRIHGLAFPTSYHECLVGPTISWSNEPAWRGLQPQPRPQPQRRYEYRPELLRSEWERMHPRPENFGDATTDSGGPR